MQEKRLGRGLDFLIGTTQAAAPPSEEFVHADLSSIRPNPYQPRMDMDPASLEELKLSIQSKGLLEPLVVRRTADGYELVAGARRLQALKELNRTTAPCVLHDLADNEMLQCALIENIHRKDLNPIEKARAIRRLTDEFHLGQEEVGQVLGMDRSTVANFLRLLDLSETIQGHVSRGTISMGHARALLGVDDPGIRQRLCLRLIEEGINVRLLERIVARLARRRSTRIRKVDPRTVDLENRLRGRLGSKVTLQGTLRRGSLIIDYFSELELDRILKALGL